MKPKTRFYIVAAAMVMAAVITGLFFHAKKRQEGLDTRITLAARERNWSEVKSLLDQGANPNGRPTPLSKDGVMRIIHDPPIEHACVAKDLEMVRLLLKKGVELMEENLDGTLLRIAIFNGDLEMFKFLLEEGADPNTIPLGYMEFNTLHTIIDQTWRDDGRMEEPLAFAELSISHGADVNFHGMHGFTPLYYATSWQQPKMVELLLKHGGDIEAKSDRGWTVMDVAAFRANAQIIDLLKAHGGTYSAQEAASLGDLEGLISALKADPEALHASHIEGDSLLGIALARGHETVAKHLIETGSKLDHLNKRSQSLLHRAAYGNSAELITLLVEKGLDVNARDQSNETPLHHTTFSDCVRSAEVLIRAGADIRAEGNSEITPTLWSASYDSPGVLKLLLAAGADPDAKGAYDGSRPLHSACHYASTNKVPETVKVLIEAGADINVRKPGGGTPLHLAVSWHGGAPLVKYLLKHGADPTLRDDDGDTAMDLAREREHEDIIAILKAWEKPPTQ